MRTGGAGEKIAFGADALVAAGARLVSTIGPGRMAAFSANSRIPHRREAVGDESRHTGEQRVWDRDHEIQRGILAVPKKHQFGFEIPSE